MKRTTKYVGLDVHQASTVVSVREGSGRIIARSVVPTDQEALTELFGDMRGTIYVAFEEGTQAQWLHDLLTPLVHQVIVCDRRGDRRQGNKADQPDADHLSDRLRSGGLRAVFHGVGTDRAALKELTRAYQNMVEDSTRVKLRLKALFRARAIRTRGTGVYKIRRRSEWLAQLPDHGTRVRAEILYRQLEVLQELRTRARHAMLVEARRDPAWKILRTIPFFGPVRTALLLATIQTPWRFRTKRNLWAYSGLAVVTRSSADHVFEDGRPVRRRRAPMTRGLNPNHNRVLKSVFKGAAIAALRRPGPLREFYDGMVARGMREELARVTLARKLAAVTLRLWKQQEAFDPTRLTVQAT